MTNSETLSKLKMNSRRCMVAAAFAVAAVAIAPMTSASAMPTGGGSATDTVHDLQARGYHVQLNANTTAPLSQCSVTDVHGLNSSNVDHTGHRVNQDQFDTVYVNVSCRPQG